ncbi:class 1b ribonucleoside-diphosphate reductase subunit beta [Alkalihalobacillus pseudalcaliphilus]|uniref:class 1b ribonucleoside-diphosphate reductase subunit beta n=1 Tax=Alkalihalobacillus pseudalcaliphilus TaxID=79884 RepID=UPI00064DD101|nr:class 1b ribonucleoside-diphosphate reductase subunit beta [Alkalihalobacillus pseudalcaliphilus]KMK75431.1 ribonucleotide-diphosphate reductase [Alkalihalobacillus pseudalcaliphilus]
MTQTFTAANWAQSDDSFTQMFYEQNVRQFWLPEEISLNGDLLTWKSLSEAEKQTYNRVLGGLTLLDTIQGNVGMTRISEAVSGHQRKAVLNFMAMMENAVHAKSYSNIFLTLASREEIDEIFRWVEDNPHLQRKAHIVADYYEALEGEGTDEITLYKALVASVMLEGFLFYSGFYYPLLLAGQGKLMNSGEIISLIIRDESIHSVYVGLLAQEIHNRQSDVKKAELQDFTTQLLDELYVNEVTYTNELYADIGLEHDVRKFLQYNANKALANLGFQPHFSEVKPNPIVMNGLSTQTNSWDFFSLKGSAYKKAIAEELRDDDFIFE